MFDIDLDIMFEQRGPDTKQLFIISAKNIKLNCLHENIPLTDKADISISNVNQIKNDKNFEPYTYSFFIEGVSNYRNIIKFKVEFSLIMQIYASRYIRTNKVLKEAIQEGLTSILFELLTEEIYDCNISYEKWNIYITRDHFI